MSAAEGTWTERRTWPQSIAGPGRLAMGVVLLGLSFAGLYALSLAVQLPMSDIEVYRAEGQAAATGGDLYGFTVTKWALPATYPPFAALLFVPTTWVSLTTLKITCVLVNAALLALLIHLSCKAAGLRRAAYSAPLLLATTALGLWLEPVFQTVVFGQINLALACLVLWDLGRPDGARLKGFATGLAAGIKLTPAIFAVYLLVTGRVKAAFTALAGFAVSVLLGALVLPGASVDFWTRRMFETQRVGKVWIVDNQSLQGLLARLLHTKEPGLWWLAAAAVTGAAGLWVARRAFVRRGLDLWGVLATAVTALLVSPISWSHHWVWCIPLLAALTAHARRDAWRRALVAAVTVAFTARSMWALHHKGTLALHFSWWQQLLAAPYPVLGLALLAALAWWTRQTPDRPGAPGGRRAAQVPSPRAGARRPARATTG
ncbi:glycosyltransferase 87 family protein [Streptomyces sp. BHT-5-2]|uniref:glycosyltransferase 87 family protein n=1 Tax=Streptomyces sp. BHT-5-2 TaxID=2866715 RepID=UPI001C8ECA16|nr:glycosyltransferase 87 family protein [Streptomyces sp. BHT-5-2]QZL03420.1 glycosyltransferase 87 family protein [Streptomyces sp. BHT-5-2]